MEVIDTVFLDIDGVLADFNKTATKIINAPYPPTKYWWWDSFKDGKSRVNAACDISFWENLNWMPDGKKILALIEDYFSTIYLLTAPMEHSGSYTGKIKWVYRHIPSYNRKTIITPINKSVFAKPGVLLIDDSSDNVKDFKLMGGEAVLVPRAWNLDRKVADIAYDIIKSRLYKYKN